MVWVTSAWLQLSFPLFPACILPAIEGGRGGPPLKRTCVLSERPVALEDGPEGERRREDAEEEVGEGQGHDEGVARVRPQLGANTYDFREGGSLQ